MRYVLWFVLLALFKISCAVASAADGPVALWKMEEAEEGGTVDSAGGIEDAATGRLPRIDGVVAGALLFDGFTSEIERASQNAPRLHGDFSVSCWAALGAYPWNWCPIITQRDGRQSGFAVEVGPRGQVRLGVATSDGWRQCMTEEWQLSLRKWYNITAVCASGKELTVYIDGEQVATQPIAGAAKHAGDVDVTIGATVEPAKPSNIHREFGTLPTHFSFDGILDELAVYDRGLSAQEIGKSYEASKPSDPPALEPRKLPSGPQGAGRFGAYYCRLKFYDGWDALWRVGDDPDVVVRFDQSPVRVVFWRGSRYSAAWVSENNLWMADQSVEAWNKTGGCFEHMQDRLCRYSHVRIIESNDARAVVHWRYAPVSAHNQLWREDPKTGRACWVDEVYTIYPDAMGVRHVAWQEGTLRGPRQFQESLPFTGPGQVQGDVVHPDWCTIANLRGETAKLRFVKNPSGEPIDAPDELTIQQYNFRSQYKPFIVFEPGNRMKYLKNRNIAALSRPGSCNHWPVGQARCDGRTSQASDRPTHFLGFPISDPPVHTKDGRSWWNGLYGMTDLKFEDLVSVARGWSTPPEVIVAGDSFESKGFDRRDRSFHLQRVGGAADDALQFEVRATEDSPLFNLPIVVENWGDLGASVALNGKSIAESPNCRIGHRHHIESADLIVWLKLSSTEPIAVRLAPAGSE
jgi:hypothetical protein